LLKRRLTCEREGGILKNATDHRGGWFRIFRIYKGGKKKKNANLTKFAFLSIFSPESGKSGKIMEKFDGERYFDGKF
jgi:hypothetical protein